MEACANRDFGSGMEHGYLDEDTVPILTSSKSAHERIVRYVNEVSGSVARCSGPDVVRTTDQILLMDEYSLDYIDARIASVTGYIPSHLLQPLRSTMQPLVSAARSHLERPGHPLSFPQIHHVAPTRKIGWAAARYWLARKGIPAPIPPRMSGRFSLSLAFNKEHPCGPL